MRHAPQIIPLLTTNQCYLCPGNKRAQGDVNPKYENTFVFVNDYSAVKESQAEYTQEGDPKGACLLFPSWASL
jgi:galactose-1-phosphate uridylyltransferase